MGIELSMALKGQAFIEKEEKLNLDPERLELYTKWAEEWSTEDSENTPPNAFDSPAIVKQRKFKEYMKALAMPHIGKQLKNATRVLRERGKSFLSTEAYDSMIENWDVAAKILEKYDYPKGEKRPFSKILELKDETLIAFMHIGENEYREGRHKNCADIFFLLKTLNPFVATFHAKLGITKHEMNLLEDALEAYKDSLTLDPNQINIKLLAAECYSKQGMHNEAKEEVKTATSLMSEQNAEEQWKEPIAAITVAVNDPTKWGGN